MKATINFAKFLMLAFALTVTALAMYPVESEAAAGVVCWDEGHACHVDEDDGSTAHHGKFQEF